MEKQNRVYQFHLADNTKIYAPIEGKNLTFKSDKSAKLNIAFEEMIGARLYKPTSLFLASKLDIYYFVKSFKEYNKFGIDRLIHRDIKSITLYYHELDELKDFRNDLMNTFYNFESPSLERKTDPETNNTYFKKAIVFVNPISGTGKGPSVLEEVGIYLKANGILFKTITTEPNKATERLINTIDKSELLGYDLIICLTGVGTVHEIINGFMRREDIDFKTQKLTIGMLPVGSGCALLENCSKTSHNARSLENALHSICHFTRRPFNISKYSYISDLGLQGDIYGFLSLSYGYTADVDVYSEKWRWMGTSRFGLYGAFKIANVLNYNIKVLYSPYEEEPLPDLDTSLELETANRFETPVFWIFASDLPFITSEYRACPSIQHLHSGETNLQVYPSSNGKLQLGKFMLRHGNYDPNKHPGLKEAITKSFRLELDPDTSKRNLVIDGESYQSLSIKVIQRYSTGFQFYSLI